jgi:hypothetical protein
MASLACEHAEEGRFGGVEMGGEVDSKDITYAQHSLGAGISSPRRPT